MLDLPPGHVKCISVVAAALFLVSVRLVQTFGGACYGARVVEVYDRVLAFISDPHADDFEDVALEVFRHQATSCEPYRAYLASQHLAVDGVSSWRQVPPVPIQAFKETELCCGPAERVFRSTGTTEGAERRSRHVVPDIRLYRQSALAGMRRFLLPDVEEIDLVSLIPSVEDAPESSLAQMVAWAGEHFGRNGIACCVEDGEPRFDRFVESLAASESNGQPLAILTTTGALIHFLDYARERSLSFRLPHASRLMDTGGDKGAPRRMSRKGLLHAIWNTFAIPGYFAVNEYGMAEMSSQYFDSVIRDRFDGVHRGRYLAAPHWLRTLVLNPADLTPLPDGQPGLLCHYDLANAGSAMAILSEDLGVIGEEGLRHLGRAPSAELRGCSMSVAEWVPSGE